MIVCRVYDKAPITRALCIAAFHLRFQIPRCHPATTLPPYLQRTFKKKNCFGADAETSSLNRTFVQLRATRDCLMSLVNLRCSQYCSNESIYTVSSSSDRNGLRSHCHCLFNLSCPVRRLLCVWMHCISLNEGPHTIDSSHNGRRYSFSGEKALSLIQCVQQVKPLNNFLF